MFFRKSFCFLFSLLVANAVLGQSRFKKKIETHFMAGIVYNKVESNNAVDVRGAVRTPIEFRRDWQFEYRPSVMVGVAFKNQIWRKVGTQVEINLLTTRQKATIDEAKSVNNNQTTTVGTVQFSTLYLHIPVVMSFKMEKASTIEIGLAQLFHLENWGREDLTTNVFSEQAESFGTAANNNPIITYSPPKVLEITRGTEVFKHTMGLLIGFNYKINPKTSVRLRYEKELQNFSQYNDLYQSRVSLNFLHRWK